MAVGLDGASNAGTVDASVRLLIDPMRARKSTMRRANKV